MDRCASTAYSANQVAVFPPTRDFFASNEGSELLTYVRIHFARPTGNLHTKPKCKLARAIGRSRKRQALGVFRTRVRPSRPTVLYCNLTPCCVWRTATLFFSSFMGAFSSQCARRPLPDHSRSRCLPTRRSSFRLPARIYQGNDPPLIRQHPRPAGRSVSPNRTQRSATVRVRRPLE